jgi:L-ascorbate metabolism protein UlaG (beta-lactamase superfamily)
VTYIGGPTALIEMDGLRLLTDPAFDPAATEYPTKVYTLRKTDSPAIGVEALGRIDAVLLSHDHHFDNLDHAGREVLSKAGKTLTTIEGAGRLKGNAMGLAPWQSVELKSASGRVLRVTATPARHGPEGGDRGPVIGFVLNFEDEPKHCVYVSGDTVWYKGVEEVARRFTVTVAVLFMGAAVVPQVGASHLTMTALDGLRAARAFAWATIVPVHFAGWGHFTEGREEISRTFAAAGLEKRLRWLQPGVPEPMKY